ncbi:chitin deacetylase 8-like [Tachypleus tridentatus]|uniref:chitin deacetylase 8-like n=1 Tax=Tachypleus tridentatus TaxID=6853 RepID=UPI003FCFDE6C
MFITILLSILSTTASGEEKCEQGGNCKLPSCRCAVNDLTFHKINSKDIPQFILLTFDDALNILNNVTYTDIFLSGKKNKKNSCPITGTFFVTHEYNDYTLVHKYWRHGNEIASHSISHKPYHDYWKNANEERVKDEMTDMRLMLSKYALIEESEITGIRAPFLQTSGDDFFNTISKNKFKWDSSMPTRRYSGNENVLKLYPYTMDYGYKQDCVIPPCPSEKYNGFWIVPMVMQYTDMELEDGSTIEVPCSMLDACSPQPETKEETLTFLKTNFNFHYNSNRAPLPLFLHETWLKNENRKQGYLEFVDWALTKDDVFMVTISEMLDYFKDPKPLSSYTQKKCVKTPTPNKCNSKSVCQYNKEDTPFEGPRIMSTCTPCPEVYPWLKNPTGERS